MTKKLTKASSPNYTQAPNVFFDEWLAQLSGEAVVKLTNIIIRYTFGWHCDAAELQIAHYEALTGLSKPAVIDGLDALVNTYKIVERIRITGKRFAYRLIVEKGKDSLPLQNLEKLKIFTFESKESLPLKVNKVNLSGRSPYRLKKETSSLGKKRNYVPKKKEDSLRSPSKEKRTRKPPTLDFLSGTEADKTSKQKSISKAEKGRRLFTFWQRTMKSPRSVYSDLRKRHVEKILDSKSYRDCLRAILGCFHSDHHMGQNLKSNPKGQLYNEFERIFGKVEETEKFIGRYESWLRLKQLERQTPPEQLTPVTTKPAQTSFERNKAMLDEYKRKEGNI